nr:MAG TPA_asm: hypothetical protein [Caudoviricetes sp.]
MWTTSLRSSAHRMPTAPSRKEAQQAAATLRVAATPNTRGLRSTSDNRQPITTTIEDRIMTVLQKDTAPLMAIPR